MGAALVTSMAIAVVLAVLGLALGATVGVALIAAVGGMLVGVAAILMSRSGRAS